MRCAVALRPLVLLDIEPNLLARARRIGSGVTEPRYELVDVGGYPAMVAGGRTQIRGEVYEIDDGTLARLDDLEGHPNYYQRQHLRLGDGRRVEAYVLPREQARGCPKIPSGDWRNRDAPEASDDTRAASAG